MESIDQEGTKPVVAILTIEDDELMFRGNRDNFIDILRVGQELNYPVYIVTVKDLKPNMPKIRGYTYNFEQEVWAPQWFPLPNVIYNRIPLREDEMTPAVQNKIQECLVHPDIKLYNPYFFNKWQLFEWLKKSKSTKPHIPNTHRLTKSLELSKLLHRHSYLYLKPESGKAGVGIMMVKYQPNRTLPFRLKIQDKKKSISYKCSSLQKLWMRIKKETGSTHYIVQQGIELASIDKRPFDLRVLIQKNRKGHWEVTGIGARMAGSLSITTHVPRGGSIEDPEKLLIAAFGLDSPKRILARAKNTALIIARQLERGSGYMLGEMSMDMGVDQQGHIWFFEANSKPMKFDEPHIRKRSIERIFQYSTYLTRQA
ncbi:endospore coat-associated protein [Paenibacillus selenitireducens]|uniref:Endospore coat-associated protein n=1 Tax=Paenibacillus selenitireducens TaxID=1324314 RepID=A0A1T2XMH0_9BACL|nr:YheC/YheD family protein [Paenibacillus selenitireducens]OPA80863.1 endospore coat-associated protein [Paenibacillus selenitireducens]